MVCGLVHTLSALNFISDNMGCFGDKPLPRNGCLVTFGDYEVYVAIELSCSFAEHMLVAVDPPAVCVARGRRIARPVSCAEVMMTRANPAAGKAGTGKTGAGNVSTSNPAAGSGANVVPTEPGVSVRPIRPSKPPLEKEVNPDVEASTS